MNGENDQGTVGTAELETSGEVEARVVPRRIADRGRSVTAYIVEHPEFCLALALVLGAAIGVVVKRR